MNFPSADSPSKFDFSKLNQPANLEQQTLSGKSGVVFVVAAADLALADRPAGVKDNQHVQITDHKMAAELNAAGKLTMVTSAGALYGPKVSPIAKKAFEEGVANIHLADGCVLKNVKGRQATQEEYNKFLSVFMASIKPIQDQHDPDKKTESPSLEGRVTHTPHLSQRHVKQHQLQNGSAISSRQSEQKILQVFTNQADQKKAKQEATRAEQDRKEEGLKRDETVRELRKKEHSQGPQATAFTKFPRDTSEVQGLNQEDHRKHKN